LSGASDPRTPLAQFYARDPSENSPAAGASAAGPSDKEGKVVGKGFSRLLPVVRGNF